MRRHSHCPRFGRLPRRLGTYQPASSIDFLPARNCVIIPQEMSHDSQDDDPRKAKQLKLPLKGLSTNSRPLPPVTAPPSSRKAFRVVRGEGQKRDETLYSRDDVARLLVASAANMMLQRMSTERAHEIQARVDRVMHLFDLVERDPLAARLLRHELDELEQVWKKANAPSSRGR